MLKHITVLLFLLASAEIGICQQLYTEPFTGSGDVNVVGWNSIYSTGSGGGVTGGFAWVWHKGNSGNIIYAREYSVNTSDYSNIEFSFDLRRHSYYSTTPEVSIAVEVGGAWYVSKTVFVETSTTFQNKAITYNPSKDNWDTLNITTLNRGATAASNLSGNITGFGLYSNSQNIGSDCTAEYDNFTITGSLTQKSADFNGDGIVDFRDFAAMANAWRTQAGSPDYNEIYDLYADNKIDILDLGVFAQNWLWQLQETHREKINFNTGWKFYKGNPTALFEHVTMEEEGTVQGQNNWYFGVSTSNTGPRSALMLYNPALWNWVSCWVYPTPTSSCMISDDRYISGGRPPNQFTMDVQCGNADGYIPRIEWVSPHPNNSSVQISFNLMSGTDTQRSRILRNGLLVWESPDLAVWTPTSFAVTLPDIDNGDILTFMQSAFASNAQAKWSYLTITENTGNPDGSSAVSFNDSSWNSVILPYEPLGSQAYTTWPAHTYQGVVWYRKHFSLDSHHQNKKLFIEFESANVTADVWVNGTYLTTHYGSGLPFMMDISDKVYYGGADNVIAVRVNSFNQTDVPCLPEFGGINGDVWLHIMDKLHVTDAVYANKVADGGIFVTYPSVSDATAQVQVKTNVINENAISKNCRIETCIVNPQNTVVAQMNEIKIIAAGSDYTSIQSAEIAEPQLWHPDHPNLYEVYTRIYDGNILVDNCKTKIGIRKIEFTKANGFKINGKPLKFRGANSNRGYPYIGAALSNKAQYRDLVRLKDAGFDYLRPSPEYRPEEPNYLDACDKLGIMLLNPIACGTWQDTDTFKNRCYQAMRNLIRRDRNHPCVIAWELSLNEQWWTAPEFSPNAMSIGHAEYPGNQCYVAAWKDSGRWGSEPNVFDIFIATPSAGAREYDGPLPMIISEHGHWEYINAGAGKTSDVRRGDGEVPMLNQAANHQQSHNLNRGLSNMCGDGVFCGTDYLAYPSGTMDKFRLPKFSYYFWQSQRDPNLIISGVNSGPMVYIANYWTSASPANVKVFSNCRQVKLYINNVLAATRSPDTDSNSLNLLHPPFTFTGLTWQAGELKAEGYINGQLAATHIVKTPGSAASLNIRFDANELATGGDITFVYVSVLDANGTVVPNASNLISLNIVSGPAVLVSPNQVQAEAGIATFLLRSTTEPGLITVQAAASILGSDTAGIVSQ